jgi:hypothetical protein
MDGQSPIYIDDLAVKKWWWFSIAENYQKVALNDYDKTVV